MRVDNSSIPNHRILKQKQSIRFKKPVKSASKKLAPNNFAPLKLACLSMDCETHNSRSIIEKLTNDKLTQTLKIPCIK